MRAVVQRVTEASVRIEGTVEGKISAGLLVLLGIENDDTNEDVVWLSRKISQLRIFNDTEDLMNLSLLDIQGEVLIISQFTLHAKTKKGTRPSFIRAAKPDIAIPLYEQFVRQMKNDLGRAVETGTFGAEMKVDLTNDGPVTIIIDTKNKE